jgi:hypothetical protein
MPKGWFYNAKGDYGETWKDVANTKFEGEELLDEEKDLNLKYLDEYKKTQNRTCK